MPCCRAARSHPVLADHDAPLYASHVLHRLSPLSTPLARYPRNTFMHQQHRTRYTLISITSSVCCARRLLAAQLPCKRSSDTFPRVSTAATQNTVARSKHGSLRLARRACLALVTATNTVHHRKHCSSEQHVVHNQLLLINR